MGAPFTVTSVSNYNANPPADDGSQVASNRVQWSTQKTKLADPIKTAFDTSETNTSNAFAKIVGGGGITTTAVDYTVTASDQGRIVKVTASGHTITTPDATVVGSPFVFSVVNDSTANITFAGNGAQTIDGVASFNIPANCGVMVNTDGSNWFTDGQNFSNNPSPPPQGSFKKLSIKVASTTTVAVVADSVITTNGTLYQNTAVNGTINLGTNGAANALDTGTIAIDTWYAIWVIAKTDGTTAALASTSFTAPTMPTGYTYKARVGAVRTIHASATLYGTWQFGRRARYVVGLAQTSTALQMVSGTSAGNPSTPTWVAVSVSSFVPTTASLISVSLTAVEAGGTGNVLVAAAPNNSYGGISSSTNPPPIYICNGGQGGATNVTLGGGVTAELLLESTNIYWATNSATTTAMYCYGWEDNI